MTETQEITRVFIRADDDPSAEGDRFSRTTHFPGPIEVLREWVRDDSPGGPCIERVEAHGATLVDTTTIVGARAKVLVCWPGAEPLVPPSHELVSVTIESEGWPDATI